MGTSYSIFSFSKLRQFGVKQWKPRIVTLPITRRVFPILFPLGSSLWKGRIISLWINLPSFPNFPSFNRGGKGPNREGFSKTFPKKGNVLGVPPLFPLIWQNRFVGFWRGSLLGRSPISERKNFLLSPFWRTLSPPGVIARCFQKRRF